MKRLITAVFMAVIATGIAVFELFYVNSVTQETVEDIEKISSLSAENRQEEMSDALDSIIEKWEKAKPGFDIFLNHDKTEEISANFAEIKERINQEEKEDLNSLCAKIKQQLIFLRESELPLIENIL